MGGFKTLPPGLAARLIAGYEDELGPLAEKKAGIIKRIPCARCGSAMQPHIHAPHAFVGEDPLPHYVARCVECGLIMDPDTRLILDTGDPRKIEEALPLIRGGKD